MKKQFHFDEITAFKESDHSPGFLLWKASTVWRRTLEKVLKEFDLTHPQFVILATTAYLTRNGENTSQVEIGKKASLDPNTTSQILRGLEKKGLLTREGQMDQRSKNPFLTSKGQSILQKALPAVEEKDREFFQLIGKKYDSFLESLLSLSKWNS